MTAVANIRWTLEVRGAPWCIEWDGSSHTWKVSCRGLETARGRSPREAVRRAAALTGTEASAWNVEQRCKQCEQWKGAADWPGLTTRMNFAVPRVCRECIERRSYVEDTGVYRRC